MLNTLAIFNFIIIFIFQIPLLGYFGIWNLLGYLIGSSSMRFYSMRVLVGIDQSWNSALRGEEDETVSSRLGRAMNSGRPKCGARVFARFVDIIFMCIAGQSDHVIKSIEKRYEDGAPSDERWSFIKEK